MSHKTWQVLLCCILICILNIIFWLLFDVIDINPEMHFEKSHFFYFSFINQMSSFLLGVYMYSLYKDSQSKNLRYTLTLMFVVAFFLLLKVKYGTYSYGGTICPFLVSISFVYLFMLTYKLPFDKILGAHFVCNIGKNSYYVYLLNTFVAWELGGYVARLGVLPDTRVYIIWLPISIFLLYILSVYYKKVIMLIKL